MHIFNLLAGIDIRGILQQPPIPTNPFLSYATHETTSTSPWNQLTDHSSTAPAPVTSRGMIIHPEFASFLVHPEVDSFRDIPKLPGQSDTTAPLHPITEGWRSPPTSPQIITNNCTSPSSPLCNTTGKTLDSNIQYYYTNYCAMLLIQIKIYRSVCKPDAAFLPYRYGD